MKRTAFLALAVLVASTPGWADFQLGTQFTIWDEMGTNPGPNATGEDQEVEPNCVWDQRYDLEGFFFVTDSELQGGVLQMVGGYDFVDGYGGYAPGDLFIDVNGNARFGNGVNAPPDMSPGTANGNFTVAYTYGYEFVVRLAEDYSVQAWALDAADSTVEVYFDQNNGSNPWRYASGGTEIPIDTGSWTFWSGLSNSQVGGFSGDITTSNGTTPMHYAAEVDLGFLYDYMDARGTTYRIQVGDDWYLPTGFTAHYTYGCGNDNLMGTTLDVWDPGTPVPEPASITLMGLGIALVAVARMRKAA